MAGAGAGLSSVMVQTITPQRYWPSISQLGLGGRGEPVQAGRKDGGRCSKG